MAAEPGVSIGTTGSRFFMAPPDFIGCSLDEFGCSTLASQAVIDKGMDDVIIAVFPFHKVYFGYDRPCFIFHPDFIRSVL